MYNPEKSSDTITIRLESGKFKYGKEEVLLPQHTSILLKGKGENGTVVIRKSALKYKYR